MVLLPPELKGAPELALYAERIHALLEEEQRQREKFREELSPSAKAEFINGEIVVHSPATYQHTQIRHRLARLLSCYVDDKRLGVVLDEKALIELTRNDYEPDVSFFAFDKAAGLTSHQLHFPVPDLIVEVLSDSTESHDRGIKFRDYAAHGVREYWLIEPDAEIVEQYENVEGRYQLLFKLNSGTLTSRVVEGFEIPVRALFDTEENLAALRRFLAERVG